MSQPDSRGAIFSSSQLGDMALSDNASLCLTSFIHRLAEISHTEEEYKELIHHTLLESVRRGLKSKTEVRRYLITHPAIFRVMRHFLGEFSKSPTGIRSAGTHYKLTLHLKPYKILKNYRN